jgi:hypothetical protein
MHADRAEQQEQRSAMRISGAHAAVLKPPAAGCCWSPHRNPALEAMQLEAGQREAKQLEAGGRGMPASQLPA